jgi:hypothetical protein
MALLWLLMRRRLVLAATSHWHARDERLVCHHDGLERIVERNSVDLRWGTRYVICLVWVSGPRGPSVLHGVCRKGTERRQSPGLTAFFGE